MTEATEIAEAIRTAVPLLARHAAEVDEQASFPQEGLQALRSGGLLGLLVPREFGGLGGGLGELVDAAGQFAGACLSTAMVWAMHCQQTDVLVRFASPELKARVLPRIARGEVYLGSVTTEVGKGGHLLSAGTPVHLADGMLLLDRNAPIVTGGLHADAFLMTMRASTDATPNSVTLVYAEREQLDVAPLAKWDALGMRGTQSVGLKLSGSVPALQTVGIPGGFRSIAVESMAPVGHLAWAACWLGTARAALAGLVELARSADPPRGLDIRSDLNAERLARVRGDLELVSAYLHRVEREVSNLRQYGRSLSGPDVQIHINMLKIASSELTFRAVDGMIQIAGLNIGYGRGSALPLERYFRDLRAARLTYANDRLLTVNGALTLMDRSVRLA